MNEINLLKKSCLISILLSWLFVWVHVMECCLPRLWFIDIILAIQLSVNYALWTFNTAIKFEVREATGKSFHEIINYCLENFLILQMQLLICRLKWLATFKSGNCCYYWAGECENYGFNVSLQAKRDETFVGWFIHFKLFHSVIYFIYHHQ